MAYNIQCSSDTIGAVNSNVPCDNGGHEKYSLECTDYLKKKLMKSLRTQPD